MHMMNQNLEQLCQSANGKQIVFDPINSHVATHFNDEPYLRDLVIDVLSKEELTEPVIAKDVNTGRIIGNNDLVEVDDSDILVYAIRKNREDQGYVPFTKSRTSQPSTLLSIYLVKKDNTTYELSSAWIGEFEMPPFPEMDNATRESMPFWSKHAFVWGSREIIPGTEISSCPW